MRIGFLNIGANKPPGSFVHRLSVATDRQTDHPGLRAMTEMTLFSAQNHFDDFLPEETLKKWIEKDQAGT